MADVAGVQPAVGVDHGGGGVGPAEVALHDLGAADEDLAGFAHPEVLAGVRQGDDAHLGAGDEPADRAGRRDVHGVRRHDVGAGRQFRHAVGLADRGQA